MISDEALVVYWREITMLFSYFRFVVFFASGVNLANLSHDGFVTIKALLFL